MSMQPSRMRARERPTGKDGRVLEAVVMADTADQRKARGAFFTPEPIARFITEWAVRDASERVMDPSCGEAAFLVQAVERIRSLRSASKDLLPALPVEVDGVEIHEESSRAAREAVRLAGGIGNIRTADFFSTDPDGTYTAVIGNPPFIRFHEFAGESRALSRASALRAGVPLSSLASSWAAFTVHSALYLNRGGRLGLVLPAELLSVNYAAEVRRFLMQSFASVSLVMFTERVFPEAQTEVVLLLADGYREGQSDHASIYQARNAAELTQIAAATRWSPANPAEKWTPSLLSSAALNVYTGLLRDDAFVPLEAWGDTTLGMVSGNNKYFALSPTRAEELGLGSKELLRLSPPGSTHLRGLAMSTRTWRELGVSGSATLLFYPGDIPSDAARAYIDAGEKAGVNTAYKCRARSPWWRVPLVKPADLFLTYMNADTPRLTTNDAKARHLNSVHGVYLKPDVREIGRTHLPVGALTSMSLLGAETVGRAYGGGILKLEPTEADRLPVPSAALLESESGVLDAMRPQMATLLRNKRLLEVAKLMDDALLIGALGMRRGDVKDLREAHADLSNRRSTRARRVATD